MRPHISIRGLIRPLVRYAFVKIDEKWPFMDFLSDSDSTGRGRTRNKEEGGTRRKKGWGGRSDEEEGATRRVKKWKVVKKMKNEEVAWGRIVDRWVLFLRFLFTEALSLRTISVFWTYIKYWSLVTPSFLEDFFLSIYEKKKKWTFQIRFFLGQMFVFSCNKATVCEGVSFPLLVSRSLRHGFGHTFAFRPTRRDICCVYGLVRWVTANSSKWIRTISKTNGHFVWENRKSFSNWGPL